MYCPQCRTEYREGFTECTDCKAPLLAGSPPPDPPDPFDPSIQNVVVLETHDAIQLAMAKGLLEDSEVPFLLKGRITTLVNDVDPFVQKQVFILVPSDREAEAREILDVVLNPDPDMAATAGEAAGESPGNV